MIDFRNIRYTTSGLECHYLGQRRSGDQVLHRFAIVNPAGEKFEFYNEQGQRIEYVGRGRWEVRKDGHQIIEQKPPKIVEVTGWIVLYPDGEGGYGIDTSPDEPISANGFIAKQKHTFRFEVPHD